MHTVGMSSHDQHLSIPPLGAWWTLAPKRLSRSTITYQRNSWSFASSFAKEAVPAPCINLYVESVWDPIEKSEMATKNAFDGQNTWRSSSGSQLHSPINARQLIPAPGSIATKCLPTHGHYLSFLQTFESQNMPMHMPSISVSISRSFETDNANFPGGTSAWGSSSHDKPTGASQPAGPLPALGGQEFSVPHFSRTLEPDNTSTLVSAYPSSQNKLPGLTGTGHLGGPCPTPSSNTMQGGSDYRYMDFPWTNEPRTMLMLSLVYTKVDKSFWSGW